MTIEQDRERYMNAAHAMQSGVAIWMERGNKETEPKHLRVGINSAMSDQGAVDETADREGRLH